MSSIIVNSQILLTINTIFGYSTVSQGLSGSSFALLKPQDIIIVADIVIVALGFITGFSSFR